MWRAYRHHEGIDDAHHEVVQFREPADIADRLIDEMLAGAKRVATGVMHFFGEGQKELVPRTGDHAIVLDSRGHPRIIWRTTGIAVAPLSAVSDAHVWRDSTGDGDRDEWLRRLGLSLARQAREHGFEMHADIETVFESLEVVWPYDVARRIRLIAPRLDRGLVLSRRLNEQKGISSRLETILSRIETSIMTLTPSAKLSFANAAAEAMLRRADGLFVREGRISAKDCLDDRRLISALAELRGRNSNVTSRLNSQIGKGVFLTVGRGDGCPPYRVTLIPLRRDIDGSTSSPDIVMFVDDPDHDTKPSAADCFSQIFRLTPAEARLAVHLASGASLTDAADAFGVTHNTVRRPVLAK